MSEKLKPCPFCGGEDLTIYGLSRKWVSCEDCHTDGPIMKTSQETIKAWNRRAND